jgi:filamentous hemagglutinin
MADVAQDFGKPASAWINANGFKGVQTIVQNWGAGARGVVIGFKRGVTVGHAFNAVNQKGTVRFLDGQIGGAAQAHVYDDYYVLFTGRNQ